LTAIQDLHIVFLEGKIWIFFSLLVLLLPQELILPGEAATLVELPRCLISCRSSPTPENHTFAQSTPLLALAQSFTSSDSETLHLALLMIDDLLNTDRSFHEPVTGQLGSLLKELSVSPFSDLAWRRFN
jgi:hypothetical protein